MDKTTVYNDISLLHPEFGRRVSRLLEHLSRLYKSGETQTNFKLFETFRSPIRQIHLLSTGASKAGPFQSAHAFGLAADLVPFLTTEEAKALSERTGLVQRPGWNWHSSHDYRTLAASSKLFKLGVPIAWDLVHVEAPEFPAIYAEMKRIL